MEIKLLSLAIERLHDKVEQLTKELSQMKEEIADVRARTPKQVPALSLVTNLADEYMNIKEVQNALGVCYNTLKLIVKDGHLTPIRINQRRIRYRRAEVLEYLQGNRQL